MFETLLWLFIKHFICDFPLQAHPWMYLNKANYGHLGGIIHAAIHGIGTYIVLSVFQINVAWILALADALIHYHVDWTKMYVNKKFNLKAGNSEWFWITLGFDQLLHHLSYFAMVWWIFNRQN